MDEDRDDIDVGIESNGTDTAVMDGGATEQDNYDQLQERMEGDDNPWYSSSTGKVVDKDGEVLIDPKTGQSFKSMDDFNKWMSQQQPTAKPENKQQQPTQPTKPMARSFDSYVGSKDGQLSPEQLYTLGKAGSDYQYSDDLVPKVSQAQAGQQAAQAPVDPVERVRSERQAIEKVTIAPFSKVRDALLAQGAQPQLVEQLLAPILNEQKAIVEQHYSQAYEKALLERVDSKYAPTLNKIEEEKLNNASSGNVNALAQKYYPEGGKDAFFSLVNGHYDDKGAFQRGPSALVIDLLASVANDGKPFGSEQDRNNAYANMFKKVTADPAKAKALFDVAHYYWLGKQSHKAQALTFEKGKQAAQQQQTLKQRTIKTRPGTFSAPQTADEYEGMPSLLRAVLDGARR